jgi:TonB family protein
MRVYSGLVWQGEPDAERTVFLSSELTTKANIISRPEPRYTDKARLAEVEGTVILRAIFATDGTVQNILVLHSLPLGLTERAIQAARQIKFTPATKDGRPVSQFIQIEYNFYPYGKE